jgi:hypothetical protein
MRKPHDNQSLLLRFGQDGVFPRPCRTTATAPSLDAPGTSGWWRRASSAPE